MEIKFHPVVRETTEPTTDVYENAVFTKLSTKQVYVSAPNQILSVLKHIGITSNYMMLVLFKNHSEGAEDFVANSIINN
ncbi:MAG: hypothetical protein AABY22_27540 [Nanoarchaeota archaeon]